MNEQVLIEQLSRLLQMDFDASQTYEQVLPKIEDEIMRRRLQEFQKSREQHIDELTEAIVRLGGEPPRFSRDLKGYLMEGYAALRSLTGLKGALKALQNIEEMTNYNYGESVSWETPDTVHTLLRKHFSDVKIHLDYINSNLQALP